MTAVIPSRGRWAELLRAIGCVRRQEGVAGSVVVALDAASPEPPVWFTRSLADAPVEIIRSSATANMAVLRNEALARVRDPWVAFLDDDDVWAPGKLLVQIGAMLESGAGWSYTGVAVVDDDLRVHDVLAPAAPEGLARALLWRNIVHAGASCVVAGTDAVRSVGGFDPALPRLNDWDLWIRLSRVTGPASCQAPLLAYVRHASNISSAPAREVLRQREYIARKYRPVDEHGDLAASEVHFLRWQASMELRRGRRWGAARIYLGTAMRHRDLGSAARGLAAPLGAGAFERYHARRGVGVTDVPPAPDPWDPRVSEVAEEDIAWLDAPELRSPVIAA